MKLLWKRLTLLILEQYLRYGANQNAQMKTEFIILLKNFFDDSGVCVCVCVCVCLQVNHSDVLG